MPVQPIVEDARWWLPENEPDRHRRILDIVHSIRSRQTHWRKRDLLHAHLYGNLPILGFGPNSYSHIEPDDGRLVINLVKPKIDTWVSMMCRARPKPKFLANETSAQERWSMRRRAKGLERWSEGLLYEAKFHDEVTPLMVLDVGIFDYGLCKVVIDGVDGDNWKNAEVCIEKAYPHEMVIDDAEALVGNPRNLFQRRWVDRYVLASHFPGSRAAIMDCPKKFEEDEWGYDDTSDQILVTEAWHLPSRTGFGDGRRSMCIETGMLLDEGYELDRFPFTFLRQSPAPWGVRGISIAAQLRPLQIAYNQFILDFQDNAMMFGRAHWLSPRQCRMEKAHFDDEVGSIWEYDAVGGAKPEAYVPQSIPADCMNFAQYIESRMDAVCGISAMRSGGIVPTQFKSGRAQEVAVETQDGRFLISSRQFEAASMDVVDLSICMARDVAKHRPDYATRVVGKHKTMVEVVRFKDVDMSRDSYVMEVYPASALAQTPSARYDQLQDMLEKGSIDLDTFNDLLDFPDLQGQQKIAISPKVMAERLIERFLDAEDPDDPDVYISPEPKWPIQQLYMAFLLAEVDAENDCAPEKNVALLRRFQTDLEFQANKVGLQLPGMPPPGAGPQNTAAPQSVPGQGPPMMPPGGPTPPPAPAAPPTPMNGIANAA